METGKQEDESSYGGRWVFDKSKQRTVFIVEKHRLQSPPIPTTVIPLPSPPSDCGSVFMSDGSLTVSNYCGQGPNSTFDNDSVLDRSHYTITDESTANETAELSDLEGQNNLSSIIKSKSKNKVKNKSKKKVTVVESKGFREGEKGKERHRAVAKNRKKIKGDCRRTVLYILFGLSLVAIIVGAGISIMTYFGLISFDNKNFLANNSDNEHNTSFEDSILSEKEATSSPESWTIPDIQTTSNEDTDQPAIASTVSVEHKIITDLLSGPFQVTLSDNDQSLPVNQAANWMAEELKSLSSSDQIEDSDNRVSEILYDDLFKFGQRFALLTMQYSLMGESVFSFDRQQGVDECKWEGVACDDFGRVIGIDFSDLELIGNIPSEVGFLYKLQILDLSHNKIAGTIPEEIYELGDLQRVYLYQNKLTGTISSRIGELNSLQYLHMSHNSLTGSIPTQLQSWSNDVFRPLKYLNLYDNNLSGTIPRNLRLRDLYYFDIGRNFIAGSIPEDIGTDFVELRYLHVDRNRLTNSIPATIPPMASGRLISVLADHNRLEGTVPDNWTMFNKLVQYTIHGKF
ncbi:unnamed protein product [Pseudo-nitzschia multistriata]|uniref:Leucine-rich repeat-containing N-terminal plant-type domain-containing protein n=1 Tax=Pseudo-nitzschia multistriata TaxID=183589 RepID=A0A448Z9I1_9STRA|nr:unnamed protein product [Pseudo-nitzschia multistriata]